MTVMEFFSGDAAENWIGAWTYSPEQVVLVGNDEDALRTATEHYNAVAKAHDRAVRFTYEVVAMETPFSTADALEALVNKHHPCAFDLCGGKEPYLTAVGLLHGRDPARVPLLPYDEDSPVNVTLQEWMHVYGGCIMYAEDRGGATQRWDMSDEFIDDVFAMWEICRAHPSKWNFQVGMLHRAKVERTSANPLEVTVRRVLSREGQSPQILDADWLYKLETIGVIADLQIADTTVSFRYKNHAIKRSFHKEGQLLELVIVATALRCKDKHGRQLYREALVGAVVDWDGKVSRQDADLYNEVDALLLHGTIPVFVSCKNGGLDVDELFKLHAVTRRFGGERAKSVLVAPRLDELGERGTKLSAAARDLGIRVVEDIETMSHDRRAAVIASLWKDQ